MSQIPENRQPLSLSDFTAPHYDSQGRRVLRHLSTWDAECAELRADNAALRARVEALEAGIREYLRDNHKRPVGKRYRDDGAPTKYDHCTHGQRMYEDCQCCVDEHFERVIATEGTTARAALQQEATTAPQSGPDNG